MLALFEKQFNLSENCKFPKFVAIHFMLQLVQSKKIINNSVSIHL
jgi:hypothetical protein